MTGFLIFIGILVLGYIGVKYLPNVGIDSQTMADANAEYIPLSKYEEKEPEPDYYVRGDNLSEEHKGIIKCSNIKSAQFLAGMLLDMFGNQKKDKVLNIFANQKKDKVIITNFEFIDNKTISVVYLKNK